jgi:hypothetical protein
MYLAVGNSGILMEFSSMEEALAVVSWTKYASDISFVTKSSSVAKMPSPE